VVLTQKIVRVEPARQHDVVLRDGGAAANAQTARTRKR
jgi:hypothetical protein